MQNLHKSRLILVSILIGWVFDQLFWKHAFGISYLILVVLLLVAGYFLARGEGIRPARTTWLLVPIILFFAAMTIFRSEPMTQAVNVLGSILFLALAAVTYTGGRWWLYSFSDYVYKYFNLGISMLSRLAIALVQKKPLSVPEPITDEKPIPQQKSALGWAILRGVVIAFPILLVLSALLASADPIFNRQVNQILKIFQIDRIGEYLFRLFYILVLAYLLGGTYLHAYTQSGDEKLFGLEKPWLNSFLGWVESIIILGTIDLLFAAFVFIQIKYFFGGQGNIHIDGYTYAEYARKGFTEMVIVAVISLVVLQTLSTITKRTQHRESSLFSGLGICLVGLVIVILVSAYQRLQLYELAYGFSRIRLYSHVFMIWLAVLLVATVGMELLHRQRAFALALVLTLLGFGVSLNLINVDRFIAQQNIQREASQKELDLVYLASLSDDAVPYLAATYRSPESDANLKTETGVVLACKLDVLTNSRINSDSNANSEFWGSYHHSRAIARRTLDNLSEELTANFPVRVDVDGASYVETGLQRYDCYDYSAVD